MANPVNNVDIHSDSAAAFVTNNTDELVLKVDPSNQEVAAAGLGARAGQIWPNWADDAFKRISQVFNADVKTNASLTGTSKTKTEEPSSDADVGESGITLARQMSTIIGDVDIVLQTIAVATDQIIIVHGIIVFSTDANAAVSITKSLIKTFRVVGGVLGQQSAGSATTIGSEGAPTYNATLEFVGNDVVLRVSDTAAQTVNILGQYDFQRMDETIT